MLFIFALLVLLSFTSAQDTASSSSATATTTSSTSTSATSSTSSTSSAATALPTISISGLPSLLTLPALNLTHPVVQVNLPVTSPLYITINICSIGANSSFLPTVLVSTESPTDFAIGTRVQLDVDSGGAGTAVNRKSRSDDIWRLDWNLGFANWTTDDQVAASVLVGLGITSDGTVDSSWIPDNNGDIIVQLGVSSQPLRSLSPAAVLLGDTTSNTALLFSPLLLAEAHHQPSYPNYTLPQAQLVLNTYPGPSTQDNLTTLSSNLSLIVVPTGSSPTNDGLDNSLCAVRNANVSTGNVATSSNMLVNATTQWMSVGGEEGYRTMWVLGELVSETNYTVWLVDDQGGMSQPIWLATKESSFPCQLVLPNDICPALSYAAPLEANATQITLPGTTTPQAVPLSTLPDNIASLISSSLEAFSTSLLSSACGRDLFSHVSTCADCYASYRDWLCRTVVPQCSSSVNSTTAPVSARTVVRDQGQVRLNSSSGGEISVPYGYTELLPCLSTCHVVDKTCPVFLQFRCPKRGLTAEQSYAFVGDDNDEGDGSADQGVSALDRWGNRWCNG